MTVPEQPDPVELDRMLLRLDALVELRASPDIVSRARDMLAAIEAEVDATLSSPTKHREWRVRRFKVLELTTALDQLLYYQLP